MQAQQKIAKFLLIGFKKIIWDQIKYLEAHSAGNNKNLKIYFADFLHLAQNGQNIFFLLLLLAIAFYNLSQKKHCFQFWHNNIISVWVFIYNNLFTTIMVVFLIIWSHTRNVISSFKVSVKCNRAKLFEALFPLRELL